MDKIRFAKKEDRNELESMWQSIFGDPAEYTGVFFDRVFTPELTLVWEERNKPVAMLYMIPYEQMINGASRKCWYLYALATKPEYRKCGIMGKLIQRAEQQAVQAGVDMLFLHPAGQKLFSYYQHFGFETECWQQELQLTGGLEKQREVLAPDKIYTDLEEIGLRASALGNGTGSSEADNGRKEAKAFPIEKSVDKENVDTADIASMDIKKDEAVLAVENADAPCSGAIEITEINASELWQCYENSSLFTEGGFNCERNIYTLMLEEIVREGGKLLKFGWHGKMAGFAVVVPTEESVEILQMDCQPQLATQVTRMLQTMFQKDKVTITQSPEELIETLRENGTWLKNSLKKNEYIMVKWLKQEMSLKGELPTLKYMRGLVLM